MMSANDLIYKETLAAADKLNADLQIKLLKLYAEYNEARDTIERIRKRAIFQIPSYAYCENEAAVYMADYLNEINGIAAAFLAEYPEADNED